MSGFDIAEPDSVEAAFGLLAGDNPAVRPIGGGTALMLMMKARLFKPERLVSLRRLPGRFVGVELDDAGAYLRVGAMTTFSELERSPLVAQLFPIIVRTMKTLANVRVRNVATVGGNLAHADPHLDLPAVWTALDAQALIVSPRGERVVPVSAIPLGYYETSLGHDELIAELRVPVRPGWRASYTKITTRSAHDWPALGLALALEMRDGVVADSRLVLSAAVDVPTRLLEAEGALRGRAVEAATLERVCAAASAEAAIASDDRGSAPYKRQLLVVHLRRALEALLSGDHP